MRFLDFVSRERADQLAAETFTCSTLIMELNITLVMTVMSNDVYNTGIVDPNVERCRHCTVNVLNFLGILRIALYRIRYSHLREVEKVGACDWLKSKRFPISPLVQKIRIYPLINQQGRESGRKPNLPIADKTNHTVREPNHTWYSSHHKVPFKRLKLFAWLTKRVCHKYF